MENAVNKALIFKADDVTITLEGTEYRLVYDLNAFCHLEKTYGSIDKILKLILGNPAAAADKTVRVNGVLTAATDITIGTDTLDKLLEQLTASPTATHTDTLNLLFAGLMRDAAKYNACDEITGYNITKARIGSQITLANIREINGKVVAAILRDLVPAQSTGNEKNDAAPDAAE